ncbi:ThuA domain-containing protein [Kribbella sp. NPDC050470]|uniref:ThuA domain-containing protein n=1 Tax=unclassified Kribbella TaxID=2644121 RepID=UPI0037939675
MAARKLLPALLALLLCLVSGSTAAAQPAATFNVLAFYSGTWDPAHIDFVKEANQRFPQFGAQNGFTYTATSNWDQLNNLSAAQYQVVMFLDDSPHTDAQRTGFQRYMNNGGAFFGFHVTAYNDASGGWAWFNNTFLGTGRFKSNTWGPTAVTLKAENRSHPALVNTGATFRSSVSEWYSWQNDLRNNADIQILASIDPSSFPVGTDPNQTWYSGYYPIVWTNKNYKMIYANFGHNAMNYETNTRLSSTFDGPAQNQFQPTSDGFTRVNNRNDATKSIDVTNVSSADNAGLQLWTYGGGANQQWKAVSAGDGYFHFVSRLSNKCLTVPNGSTADSTQLVQLTCSGNSAQSFRLTGM